MFDMYHVVNCVNNITAIARVYNMSVSVNVTVFYRAR